MRRIKCIGLRSAVWLGVLAAEAERAPFSKTEKLSVEKRKEITCLKFRFGANPDGEFNSPMRLMRKLEVITR
jgi:hypothetical protein